MSKEIKKLQEQLQRKNAEYNKIADLLRDTDVYSQVCDTCKDEILIYTSISGKTDYTDNEVDIITLKKIIDMLKNKEQECKDLKEEIICLKKQGGILLADKNAFQIGYDTSIARVKELEEKLNAQFAEMEEKLTAEEMKNFELSRKLNIALSSLNDIATFEDDIIARETAQQALQKMEEVKLSNNSNPKKTIKIFGKEIDEDVARKVLQQVLDGIADYKEECKKNGKNTKEVSND